jgi:hypothetical protein
MQHTCKTVSFFLIVFFVGGLFSAEAQSDASGWQFGFNGGTLVYLGTLSPTAAGSYKTLKPSFGLYLSKVLNPSLLLRTNLTFGQIAGDENKYAEPAYHQQRQLSFSTPVAELSELLVWNILANNSNQNDYRFSPYAFGGIGVNFISVNRLSNPSLPFFTNDPVAAAGLAQDLATQSPESILVIPMGIGVEYFISDRLSLTAETNFRYTSTDYLDGFSKVSSTAKNDYYQSHTIGLVYRFAAPSKLDCPSRAF